MEQPNIVRIIEYIKANIGTQVAEFVVEDAVKSYQIESLNGRIQALEEQIRTLAEENESLKNDKPAEESEVKEK